MRYLIAVFAVLAMAGCEERNEMIDPGPAQFPMLVNLHAGQSYSISQFGITATFDSVTADSRCPLGVLCIWAGDGATRLSLRGVIGDAAVCTLHTTLTPHMISFNGLSFQLQQLGPIRTQHDTITQGEYIALLQISPSPGR